MLGCKECMQADLSLNNASHRWMVWKEVCEQRQTVVDSWAQERGSDGLKDAHDDAEWNAESDLSLGDFIYHIPKSV